MTKTFEEILKEVIEAHNYLREKNGRYEQEIYVDHSDGMSDDQLVKISQSDNKMETFYDQLGEYASDTSADELDELLRKIESHWDEEEHGEFDEDAAREWTQENVDFNFPYNHYLDQEVYVNILVDTGDGDQDFTKNNFASYNAREDEGISEESSVLWLVKQQGYTKDQLEAAIGGNYSGSVFLKSVHRECVNVTSHMNALAFFVKMSLQDFIDFCDKKNAIALSADTSCGLYDCWNGAGGTLEIELEKPVTVPRELIQAHLDGARGYGVDQIYGMMRSFWKDSVIEVK